MVRPLQVPRDQVLAFRRAANGLDRRQPHTPAAQRDAVEAQAAALPLPTHAGRIGVRWEPPVR